MRVAALVSGGKDSTYNIMQCMRAGHQIIALANILPHAEVELDSYMYQTAAYEAIPLIAEAMDLPIFFRKTQGKSLIRDHNYRPLEGDEVEDLYELLLEVKERVQIEAVSVGAILSNYQRVRVENVCTRLNLVPLAFLWQRDEVELLEEMVRCNIDAVLVKVSCLGLNLKHLGKSISSLQPHLVSLKEKYGIHVCGEGGEYETLTLDCPLYKSRIVIEESEVIILNHNSVAPTGYLKLPKLKLVDKELLDSTETRLANTNLKASSVYAKENIPPLIQNEEPITCDPMNLELNIQFVHMPLQPSTVAVNPEGWMFVGGVHSSADSLCEALEKSLNQLKAMIEARNQELRNICSITLFVSDMSQFNELNIVYCKYFDFDNPPTRALVEIPIKAHSIILSAILWSNKKISSSCEISIERSTMHIKSHSHWAPASIGPYSQAVRVGDLIYLAGQIGLIPATLDLLDDSSVYLQCHMTLRHIDRIISAHTSESPHMDLRNVLQAVCYVTSVSYVREVRSIWEEKTNNAIVCYVVVSSLPKNAKCEWHVWANKFNNRFQYEETGRRENGFSFSIYRRWNCERAMSAIVANVERVRDSSDGDNQHIDLRTDLIRNSLQYVLQKLNENHKGSPSLCNITIYYATNKVSNGEFVFSECLLQDSNVCQTNETKVIHTIIPVVCCKDPSTLFSVSGIRC